MYNSSLLTADRATHVRIVVVALTLATLIVSIGLAARFGHTAGQIEPTLSAPKALVAVTDKSRTVR
jgi:hypothetical protein